tara:strand:+ start:546 stop:1412 length:867 start_codon:yes stop_codon:yes gene_type:complete
MNCVICSTVYKNENYLHKSFENIKEIQKLFNKTKILISYDNSGDNSLKELCEIKKTNNFDIDILFQPNERFNSFIGRPFNIAQARNQLLNEIYTKYEDYDYFIMVDLDDIFNFKINIEILEKYLESDLCILNDKCECPQWDSLCFWNEGFYDTWSVSIDHLQDSSWRICSETKEQGEARQYEVLNYLKSVVDDMNENNEDIRNIDSCFNGFAIHKIKSFKNIKYTVAKILDNKIIIDCEHRDFYKSAVKKGLNVMFSKDCLLERMTDICFINKSAQIETKSLKQEIKI